LHFVSFQSPVPLPVTPSEQFGLGPVSPFFAGDLHYCFVRSGFFSSVFYLYLFGIVSTMDRIVMTPLGLVLKTRLSAQFDRI